MRVLPYTSESLRKIQTELEKGRIFTGRAAAGKIPGVMGYSKQINQKMPRSGKPHPDRNARFEYINARAAAFLKQGGPVISVDAKKKEKTGDFKNGGGEYRPEKQPSVLSKTY
jgi:hypothetical protein